MADRNVGGKKGVRTSLGEDQGCVLRDGAVVGAGRDGMISPIRGGKALSSFCKKKRGTREGWKKELVRCSCKERQGRPGVEGGAKLCRWTWIIDQKRMGGGADRKCGARGFSPREWRRVKVLERSEGEHVGGVGWTGVGVI